MHAHQRDILSPLSKSGSRIPKKTPPTVQSCRCTCYRNMVEHTRATVRPNTLNDDHNLTILRAAPMQQGKKRDFATAANCHQCRAAARHAACTCSRRGVGHGRTSRPCYPVSARRARGLANASESQESRLCHHRMRLLVPRCRPDKLPSLAPGCVGHGLTSARAKPAHTRRAWGLETRQNHPRWR